MTDNQFQMIYSQLVAIREALEMAAVPKPTARPPATTSAASPAQVPPPASIVQNAGEVRVHFGKNAGVRLADLPSKSLAWYAQDREPRLRNDGTPFPPRQEDVLLREAARTLLHHPQIMGSAPAPTLTTTDDGNPY